MTLTGESTLYQHKKAKTMYLTIPASIASDSQFELRAGDIVKIILEKQCLKIKKMEDS